MTRADLLNCLSDRPFSPFGIHLSDGAVPEIKNPEMVIVGETSVILPCGEPMKTASPCQNGGGRWRWRI
jgi:hypothetical protein